MADHTHIGWTNATWNIITGCSIVSPGCTNCYAMKLAGTRLKSHPSREGLTIETKAGPVWTGEVRFNEDWLLQPLRWRDPRMIFVAAHGDLFHEGVTDEQLDAIFTVMAMAPQHTFQVLTKRPKRMVHYFAERVGGSGYPWAEAADFIADLRKSPKHPNVLEPRNWPLRNVWLGTSVEDQTRADERIPVLLMMPAAVHFISAEPLLGPIDLTDLDNTGHARAEQRSGINCLWKTTLRPRLNWVIIGGESQHGARPMELEWARDILAQCNGAGVPVFMKQLGSIAAAGMKSKSGANPAEWPVDLRIQQFPKLGALTA